VRWPVAASFKGRQKREVKLIFKWKVWFSELNNVYMIEPNKRKPSKTFAMLLCLSCLTEVATLWFLVSSRKPLYDCSPHWGHCMIARPIEATVWLLAPVEEATLWLLAPTEATVHSMIARPIEVTVWLLAPLRSQYDCSPRWGHGMIDRPHWGHCMISRPNEKPTVWLLATFEEANCMIARPCSLHWDHNMIARPIEATVWLIAPTEATVWCSLQCGTHCMIACYSWRRYCMIAHPNEEASNLYDCSPQCGRHYMISLPIEEATVWLLATVEEATVWLLAPVAPTNQATPHNKESF
jgi:hypothetical protein